MSSWGELPYGWVVIALGASLVIITGTIIVIPLEHGQEVRYAKPWDHYGYSGEPAYIHDANDLTPECQTVLRRLATGENVSRQFYATHLGETYVVHNTNFSDRPVVPGPGHWLIEENSTGWTHGRGLADWQLQEDYCADLIRGGTYRLDGDRYEVSGRGEFTHIYASYRSGVGSVFVLGILLMAVGQRIRWGPSWR